MKKVLVIVTKPLSLAPKNLSRILLGQADHVALIQDGIYVKPGDIGEEEAYGMPRGHKAAGEKAKEIGGWPENWSALKEDASARGVEVGCRLIDYAGLVEAIEGHEKIVTI